MIIRTEIEPTRRLVHLVGRFDAHECPGFRSAVTPLVTAEANVIHIDLSQVAFVDSTALAELVRLQKAARALDGEVILADPSDPVRVILEITALAEMFTIIDTTGAP
ncbi:STAS domain-containing protein [Homoserinibacter sp. GY 40078]|uniref:STAS domain-containing protein n=1 Tax=Homoserinibacter sp. GY 40078 TaxID=2603275 RepID=UPI0011C943B7|nr:STAS domain-containing protein [Homoserinibacter sp. GY 40078]TXK17258.1 STAS domain-containing protein [Homoserinibacter sp. GY 40078]